MADLLYKEEAYAIVGAAMEVYNHLGPGFLEAIYQECMERELTIRNIAFKAQGPISVRYKGEPLHKQYVADLVCYHKIIVELKALDNLSSREDSQLLNYLKATGMKVGLLINFGRYPSLEWRRLILTGEKSSRNTSISRHPARRENELDIRAD